MLPTSLTTIANGGPTPAPIEAFHQKHHGLGSMWNPPEWGESRPGWKILRVLGNLLEMPLCEYDSSEAIRDERFAVAQRNAEAIYAF